MDDGGAVAGLAVAVGEEGGEVGEARVDGPDGLLGVDVDGLGLRVADGAPGEELPVVEARGFPEGGEAERRRGEVDLVQLGEGGDGGAPEGAALFWGYVCVMVVGWSVRGRALGGGGGVGRWV